MCKNYKTLLKSNGIQQNILDMCNLSTHLNTQMMRTNNVGKLGNLWNFIWLLRSGMLLIGI